MATIGIDLGTTNSLAVTYREGEVELIPNGFGEYLTPSVVHVSDDVLTVGKIAKERLVTDPENTAQLFKRSMGTNEIFYLDGEAFSATDLSTLVVKQLVADAESYLGEKVDEVLISVPAYFNEKQRSATKAIGQRLGIKVERLINEPSAYSLIVSVCRQMVVLLPVAWLLSRTGRLELVWWSFPIAEVMSFTLSTIFLRRTVKSANEVMNSSAD